MPTLKIKIPASLLKGILTRQMSHDITHALADQPTPFTEDEKLVVLGSGIASLEGYENPNITPVYLAPPDLDIMLYEPKGEKGRPGIGLKSKQRLADKEDQKRITHKLLANAAKQLGGELREKRRDDGLILEAESVANQHYYLTKEWKKQDIETLLAEPQTQKILRKIFGTSDDYTYQITNLDEFLKQGKEEPVYKTTSDIQFIGYPASFLKPVPLAGFEPQKGKVEILADDSLNTLAFKLVRLTLPKESRQLSDYVPINGNGKKFLGRVRNLIDVHDILKIRKEKGLPPPDPDKLRILFLAHLAYQEHDDIRAADASRLIPTKEHLELIQHDLGNFINQQAGRHDKRPLAFPPKHTHTFVTEAHDLLKQIFPDLSEDNVMPLTQNDKDFIGLVKGSLISEGNLLHSVLAAKSARDGNKSYTFRRPHVAVTRLYMDHKEACDRILADDPDFLKRIAENWNVRPLSGGMDEALTEGAISFER